jgi:hypothetical protein
LYVFVFVVLCCSIASFSRLELIYGSSEERQLLKDALGSLYYDPLAMEGSEMDGGEMGDEEESGNDDDDISGRFDDFGLEFDDNNQFGDFGSDELTDDELEARLEGEDFGDEEIDSDDVSDDEENDDDSDGSNSDTGDGFDSDGGEDFGEKELRRLDFATGGDDSDGEVDGNVVFTMDGSNSEPSVRKEVKEKKGKRALEKAKFANSTNTNSKSTTNNNALNNGVAIAKYVPPALRNKNSEKTDNNNNGDSSRATSAQLEKTFRAYLNKLSEGNLVFHLEEAEKTFRCAPSVGTVLYSILVFLLLILLFLGD